MVNKKLKVYSKLRPDNNICRVDKLKPFSKIKEAVSIGTGHQKGRMGKNFADVVNEVSRSCRTPQEEVEICIFSLYEI